MFPAPPHDVIGHTWHHDSQLLFDYTKLDEADALAAHCTKGFNSGMPGLERTLTNEDIWHVLAYIRSTLPDGVQQMRTSRNLPQQ
ncbi:cytochrome c [Ruegeria profundi]|uniref:cytochrome c n=1 Tax=Ruegeria profundi TaxID=1685378 RepID=UPI001CD31A0A|nr:cytochrome c [Ruegeria profundi]MCA0930159.1 cytochrome c [Ruegeria profundi]